MIGKTVANFRIVEKLGGGGMGVVYLAEDVRLRRKVALKFLPTHLSGDDESKQRFIQEARAASSLNHPNICTIHDIGETEDGHLFIAMAFYDGETLKKHIAHGPISVSQAVAWAAQIADGLAAAHEQGFVHRDIKPANIIVTRDGRAVILDFGLAKLAGTTDITIAGTTVGTVSYMSPEQVRGGALDGRTDIWSLGVLLYEMVSGRRPFPGEYDHAVMYAITNAEHEPIFAGDDVPDGLSEAIERCLAKDPFDRFDNAAALKAALSRIGAGNAVSIVGGVTTQKVLAVQSRSRPSVVAVGIGVLAVLAIGIFVASEFAGRKAERPSTQLVAVLPFGVIGDAEEGQIYSAGLVETLTSKLSRLDRTQAPVGVVPASETRNIATATEARASLGATLAVTGSLQFAGDRIRVTMNLIDTETRRQLDSRQVDYQQTNAIALQDEALFVVADMLQVQLAEPAREEVRSSSSASSIANDLYLRGVGRLRQEQSLDDAIASASLLELAVREDSTFALAYAGLAEAYWLRYRLTQEIRWADEAIAFSRRAIRFNDALAPVHVTHGIILNGRAMYEEALGAFARAEDIDRSDPATYRWRARVYRNLGRFQEAESEIRRSIALEPAYWEGYNHLGALYVSLGRYREAAAAFEKGLQSAPSNQGLLSNLGVAYWGLEMLDDAVSAFERVLDINPSNTRTKKNLATAYFYLGRFEDAARLYEEELSLTPQNHVAVGYLADAYYWIPRYRDRADHLYRRAIAFARENLEVSPESTDLFSSLATYYARLGRRDTALVLLKKTRAVAPPDSVDAVTAFGIGEIYEHLGERETALTWMTSALDRGYGWIELQHSPWLAALRKEAFAQRLIANRSSRQ